MMKIKKPNFKNNLKLLLKLKTDLVIDQYHLGGLMGFVIAKY